MANRRRRFSPVHFAVFLVVAILILPVIVVLVLASLRSGTALPFSDSPLTLVNYADLLFDPLTWRLLANTAIYAAVSLAIGLGIAVPLVWLVERTDLPGRTVVSALIFVPLVIPGALNSMGWSLLAAPRTGFLNEGLRSLLGIGPTGTGPLDIYTFAGLVLITGTGIVPSMFVILSSTFRNMDARLEEAGRTSGARALGVVRYITLPMMLPGLAAAGVYFTMVLIEMFEVPLVIGLNANFRVLSTHVFSLIHTEAATPEYGIAAAFGVMSVAIGILLVSIYLRITRAAYKFVVVGGQRQAFRLVRLGRWRYVALVGVILYMCVVDLLPILALLWTSLVPPYTEPSIGALQHVSLDSYTVLLQDSRLGRAVANTLVVVVSASIGCVVLAALVAWVVTRGTGRWTKYLDVIAFLPRGAPGVILALGVFLLYIRTPLYATVWIIVIGHIVNYLPYSVRLLSSTLVQIHKELEEAARASGAGTLATIRSIVFPLMMPPMLNCAIWVASHSVRDFTFALMLGTAANTVISGLLWQTWAQSRWHLTSAMAIVLIGVLLVIAIPIRYTLTSRRSI